MNAAAGMSVSEIRSKGAQAHGANCVFFAFIACIAYAFFGARDFGILWALIVPGSWFWMATITALPAAWMIKQVAERRHNLSFYISGTIMTLRPVWITALAWFSVDALARLLY